jgi:ParB-like chromosome segregation protein Spo0J
MLGRVLAARKLGMQEVPCIQRRHLTPAQRRAYIIADNKLALNAGWDEEQLKIELGELKLNGFDLSMTRFGEPDRDAGPSKRT